MELCYIRLRKYQKNTQKCEHAIRRRLEAREICGLRAKYAHKIRNLEAKNFQPISKKCSKKRATSQRERLARANLWSERCGRSPPPLL